jgi:hypothetical protein
MQPTAVAGPESRLGLAGTHLLVGLRLPTELGVRLPGCDEMVVRPKLLSWTTAAAWLGAGVRGREAVAVDFGGEAASVVLEAGLAVGVVNAVLGLGPPPFAGPLTRIERGVLTGSLATLVAELGLPPGLRIGGEPVLDDSWREVVEFSVGLGSHLARGCLAMSDGFLERIGRAALVGVGALEPRLELATTTVAQPDLASAASGDQVVFDETAALPPDADWPVQARCGETQAPAWWLPDGRLLAREEPPGGDKTPATRPDGVAAAARRSGMQNLAETAVRVVAGYGGSGIASASAAGLVIDRRAPVALEVGGRLWAYGELGQVAGSLAVAITRRLAT